MHKILVLCHGNINRSPLCAAVLKKAGLSVKSAGFLEDGTRAAKKMRDAAAPLGLDLTEHRSTLITPELTSWADMIVYMDNGNHKRLKAFEEEFPTECRVPWVCLGFYVRLPRIPDPGFMARDSKEFSDTVALIVRASEALAQELIAK